MPCGSQRRRWTCEMAPRAARPASFRSSAAPSLATRHRVETGWLTSMPGPAAQPGNSSRIRSRRDSSWWRPFPLPSISDGAAPLSSGRGSASQASSQAESSTQSIFPPFSSIIRPNLSSSAALASICSKADTFKTGLRNASLNFSSRLSPAFAPSSFVHPGSAGELL